MTSAIELMNRIRQRMGWSDEFLASINNASHPPLKDVDLMAKAIEDTRIKGEAITIMPDFDTDGICAGTIMYAGLAQLGFHVSLHVPNYADGHDIQPHVIDEMMANKPATKVMITCDAGTNSHHAIHRASEYGVMSFITDHHIEEGSCPAHLIINPNRRDEDYPNKEICGSTVAYQIIERYTALYQPHQLSVITWLRVFAGIGTVADVMSLVYENRALVRDSVALTSLLLPKVAPYTPRKPGKYEEPDPLEDVELPELDTTPTLLKILSNRRDIHPAMLNAFDGISCLLQATGATEDSIDEQLYGFSIAPAFNSTRRVGGDYRMGFGVFISPEHETRLACAEKLVEYNDKRKVLSEQYFQEAMSSKQEHAPYVYITQAPPGMLGLIAQRIMSVTNLPVCVVRSYPGGEVSGSLRSPTWYDALEHINVQGDTHTVARGHANACGVNAPDPSILAARIEATAQEIIAECEASGEPLLTFDDPALVIGWDEDADVSLSDIDTLTELIDLLAKYKPFGHGFPHPPIDVIVPLSICKIDTLGKNNQHLKISTPEGVALLWWNHAPEVFDLRSRKESTDTNVNTVRFRITLGTNTFRNIHSLQGIIQDQIA